MKPIVATLDRRLMPRRLHLLVQIQTEEEILSTSFSAFPKFGTLEKLEKSGKLEKLKKLETLESKSNFLSKQFANFFSSYTQSFNKVYGRRGSLFLKNFNEKKFLMKTIFGI